MIDVEGNNKLGAHEDEMQPQNILCEILLNPKTKTGKRKTKKKEPANNTCVQIAKLVMQTTQ
jgi:hypothetical protein